LRSALVSPDEFRRSAFRGATSFYAKPPNLASADILAATKSEHRDSLRADATELARQHAREVDLIKILARLYGSYLESLTAHGCLTVTDAVYEAVAALRADAALAKRVRSRFPVALVDDAQDLTAGKIALLEAIYGKVLSGVTLAGDPEQSTLDFAGARGNATLASATQRLEFATQYRSPAGILRAAALARDPNDARTVEIPRETATELYRAESSDDEARYVAETIATLLARGERPEQIAVVTRSLHCANAVTKALLARNVPLDVAGAANLYAFPAVADGLAALWALADPYRHDWLSRNLEAPWLALSDASIATLCGEVPEAQPLLFELPDDEVDETRSRWDRRRDLRLGRNLTRGDADSLLPDEARERVVAFRSARLRWERLERELDLPALCATILGETVLAATRDDARGRFERGLIARLLDEIERFAARRPLATLDDFLAAVEEVSAAESDLLAIAPQPGNHGGCVRLLDVETAKGREFNHLFIIGASAGSFPRYYVPDGFMYSPSLGIAPKENVGDDARAARTAKFSYVFYKLKVRDKYNAQERRAFACAATRARVRLYVSAAGRATRGVAAPEILAELQEAHAGD
jgi:DNA helicase-2/ATP-dependent DNA helicase PcrA